MTAGNRAPISVLKDGSPFHARHTDTSEAADTLHERGTARKILLTEPPPASPPPRRKSQRTHRFPKPNNPCPQPSPPPHLPLLPAALSGSVGGKPR